ncbi:MAG TPA: EamA family transporter [Dongiaceae bacterium]
MTLPADSAPRPPLWQGLMPPLFVVLWASGFVVTKLGVEFAEPFTFLLYRFAIVAVLMLAIALITGAPWPRSRRYIGHVAVVGLLMQGAYLGGVYAAIDRGIPAGICALIVGMQPLLTAAAVGPFLGERVSGRQWLGLALGFAGIMLVLWQKLDFDGAHLQGLAWNIVGLLGLTTATLYQKRFCSDLDWRSGGFIQYVAATAACFAMTLVMGETGAIEWSREIVFAYVWLILGGSIGAVSLLGWLIRRGEASRVVSVFYLVPPTAAFMGWLIFGETLGPLALIGMAAAVAGVALVMRK